MNVDLLVPGRRRGKEVQAGAAVEHLHELYLEYHHTACSPFKMLRLDRYFIHLDLAVGEFMQKTRGGEKWDNRRRSR